MWLLIQYIRFKVTKCLFLCKMSVTSLTPTWKSREGPAASQQKAITSGNVAAMRFQTIVQQELQCAAEDWESYFLLHKKHVYHVSRSRLANQQPEIGGKQFLGAKTSKMNRFWHGKSGFTPNICDSWLQRRDNSIKRVSVYTNTLMWKLLSSSFWPFFNI